jgi:PilZ domain
MELSHKHASICWLMCAMTNISDKPLILVPGPVPGQPETGAGSERRRVPRHPFTAAAIIVELRSQTRVVGRTSDLGVGGCYIDVFSPFGVGSAVSVRMEHEQQLFEAIATVCYSKVSMGMGLAFTEVKPEHQAILMTWLGELNGETLPKPEVATAEPVSGLTSTVLNLQQVLNELVSMMVRKKVINEVEGAALLRQVFR